MTDDEKDRALCEAHCNSAADEYFNARSHLDSPGYRRIFYAGHRKAWIERGEAVRLNAQAVPDGMVLVPKRLTREMESVINDEDWRWEDLLAAAEAITLDEYSEIAASPAAPQPAQAVPCDCTTEIHADGTRKTWCGSDQMRRATEEGHAFAAAPQPAQQSVEDAVTWQELEAFRKRHWTHWNASENLMIAHLVQTLRIKPEPSRKGEPAQQPLTDDPCPCCEVGGVCKTPECGRLKLPVDHPLRTGAKND